LADTDDPAVAAARLEKALERIAALAERARVDQLQADAAKADAVKADAVKADAVKADRDGNVDVAAMARRLDALIAALRAALAGRPG